MYSIYTYQLSLAISGKRKPRNSHVRNIWKTVDSIRYIFLINIVIMYYYLFISFQMISMTRNFKGPT